MKVKISHFIAAFFLIGGALFSVAASAQQEGLSPTEVQDPLEYNLNDDKPLLMEHDSKSKVSLSRDSLASHNRAASSASAKPKSPEHNKSATSKEEDDALSFNFLYYIIQKFKISDLVDE